MIKENWTAEDAAGNNLVITNVQRDATAHSWTITLDGRKWARAIACFRKNKNLMRRLRAMAACMLICLVSYAQQGDTVSVKVDMSRIMTAEDTLNRGFLFIRGDTSQLIKYRQVPDTVAVMLMVARTHRNNEYYVTSMRGYQVLDFWGRHIKFLNRWKKDLSPSYYVWQVGALPARKSKNR